MSYEEKRARGSKRIAEELDVHQSYISTLLTQMAKEGTIHYKKAPVGKGFIFWNKEQRKNKEIGRKVADNILIVLSNLKGNETITAIEIERRLRDLKVDSPTGSISAALTEMYRKHSVKRSKSVYKRKYWYWLKGDEKEKNIENEIELKHYFSDPNPTGKSDTQLDHVVDLANKIDTQIKHADELHNVNVSLRELVGKYRKNNKELKRMIDGRDKEIEHQQSRIAYLHSELQNITAMNTAMKTEQDVVKDIFESRKILEDTFK